MSRHIAILGAGPTGLEAALEAADRGWSFTLYEASDAVAGSVRDWGHVRLFSPWSLDVSPRARTALEAAGQTVPASEDECPTGLELFERVLAPLATLPQIAPHLELQTAVKAISRQRLLKSDEIGTGHRGEHPFRLLLASRDGRERAATADVVLDCTGTWGHPNALGDGGIPALGERELDSSERLVRSIPDFSRDAEEWSGRKILVVGAGHSAQTAVRDLARLAGERPGTRVLWALRSPEPPWKHDPEDPLPARAELTREALDLAGGASPAVTTFYGAVVEALEEVDGSERLQVRLRLEDGEEAEVEVDRVVSLTGSVGDASIYRQLQVHECYATAGPMKLAAALLGSSGGDCLEQSAHGVETLVNPEPGFFVLGSKSYGRNNTYLLRVGWQQVDEVFELLAREAS